MTASTSGDATTSSNSVLAVGAPYWSATSRAWSSRRLTTATISAPSMRARASRCLMPKAPAPARAMRMFSTTPEYLLRRFQDEVTDGRIRRRYVIEAVELFHLLAEGAAHDEPHDHFDALGDRKSTRLN